MKSLFKVFTISGAVASIASYSAVAGPGDAFVLLFMGASLLGGAAIAVVLGATPYRLTVLRL